MRGSDVQRADAGPSAYVAVLLSTYKPGKYLLQQIESVLAQTMPEGLSLRILIRDDASPDPEAAVWLAAAQELAADRIEVDHGLTNLGPAKSFLLLLSSPLALGADYVAFCDQDDIWLVGKLARAIDFLSAESRPALYCARAELVSPSMQVLGYFPPRMTRGLDHRSALAENLAVGCTVVLNPAAVSTIVALGQPRAPAMHDAWCFLVISLLGVIYYDPLAQVRYRQHEANAIGATSSVLSRLARRVHARLRNRRRPRWPFFEQASSLLELAQEGGLPPDLLAEVQDFVGMRRSLLKRLRYVMDSPSRRADPLENMAFKFKILLGFDY